MKQLEYTVRFVTPAFLGNAEQAGQWRTPPFKALLRQWWRVAVAKSMNYDVPAIRSLEGKLFGVAADGGDSHKSPVRIRLDDWSLGTLTQAPDIGHVSLGKNSIAAALYSGYGPVAPATKTSRGPTLKANAAIQAEAEARLRIAFPEGEGIEQSLALANAFGTIGGRSRNGWGSFELLGDLDGLKPDTRDWKDAMGLDWPHNLGRDEKGPLLWQSSPFQKWEDAMRVLAQTRADLRRAVPDRLMLAYPSTRGSMPGWANSDRVPHSIRFKVRRDGEHFIATAFHLPCRPAEQLWKALPEQKRQGFIGCFSAAHSFFDRHSHFKRAEV